MQRILRSSSFWNDGRLYNMQKMRGRQVLELISRSLFYLFCYICTVCPASLCPQVIEFYGDMYYNQNNNYPLTEWL